jgi:hypothetical protein
MQPSEPPPGPPPGPPPPGYPYYAPPPRRTNGNAVAAMVVSLASLVTCPLIGAVGIYLGTRAQREIAASGEEGEGMAKAGVIVGWVAIGLSVLMVCFVALTFGLAGLPILFI